jgi:hypothetical protein
MNDQDKGISDETNHGVSTTPSSNPQREDLVTKQKERAVLMQREKKTANSE